MGICGKQIEFDFHLQIFSVDPSKRWIPTAHSEISEVTETCISSKWHLPDMGLQFLKQKFIY